MQLSMNVSKNMFNPDLHLTYTSITVSSSLSGSSSYRDSRSSKKITIMAEAIIY